MSKKNLYFDYKNARLPEGMAVRDIPPADPKLDYSFEQCMRYSRLRHTSPGKRPGKARKMTPGRIAYLKRLEGYLQQRTPDYQDPPSGCARLTDYLNEVGWVEDSAEYKEQLQRIGRLLRRTCQRWGVAAPLVSCPVYKVVRCYPRKVLSSFFKKYGDPRVKIANRKEHARRVAVRQRVVRFCFESWWASGRKK